MACAQHWDDGDPDMQRMSVADLRAQLQLLQHQLKASRVPFSPDFLVQRAIQLCGLCLGLPAKQRARLGRCRA